MSTSCSILLREDNIPLVCIQAHADGYPSGRGLELANFLAAAKIVNGIGLKADVTTYNTAGCLTASLVKTLKQGIGGIYLIPAHLAESGDFEYMYAVDISGLEITRITVFDENHLIFDGDTELFQSFCKNHDN